MTWNNTGYLAAKEANDRMNSQRDAYRSTTEPLNKINDTLKAILEVLKAIENKMGTQGDN